MNAHEWWMPVNAHPQAVRWRSVGETRAVDPTEARTFLPIRRLAAEMLWPNRCVLKGEDACHFTGLTLPG